jgi:hypothetical protein
MQDDGPTRLPTVVVSSVVRSSYQGESHGGVYLVQLETGSTEQALDWSQADINWEGRGGDRGLRGIAFHSSRVYLAASDEIFVFDPDFRRLGSFRNPYLKHCHEIFVLGNRLFATSTGFDSILEYDLHAERFVRGYRLRFASIWRARRRFGWHPRPSLTTFDPSVAGGPTPADTCHINSVTADERGIFFSGTGLGDLWSIRDGRLHRSARIAYGSHNARPFRAGVLLNHTRTDRVTYMDRKGRVLRSWPIQRFELDDLQHADLPEDLARQAFGRGLAIVDDDLFVAGSSPASVTAYRFDESAPQARVTLTKDIRNAVHGLEVWPFS